MKSPRSAAKLTACLSAFVPFFLMALCWPAAAQQCSSHDIDSLDCGAALTCTTYGSAVGLVTSGNYAYVAAYDAGLAVVDISVPGSPVFLDTCPTPGDAHGVAVSGTYAFVPDYLAGFTVLDVTNPASPQFVANLVREGDQSYAVALSGNYAFVANGNLGLSVYDVSVPASPSYVTSLDTDGSARAVAISGSYAYIGDAEPGLVIADISNPMSPVKVGFCDTPGHAQWVALSGTHAYVADYDYGLAVVDVSNPAAPAVVASNVLPGLAWGVWLSGHYAFVADDAAGLYLFDIDDPLEPAQVDSCDTPGLAMGVVVSGDYAFVADERQGLRVIPFMRAPVPATVDFDPNTLNLKSNGRWVTCYIELPEGCDVSDIDVATVKLNGLVPAEPRPTEIGDYDMDGVLDLMVKFDRSEAQAILTPGHHVAVTVTGSVGGAQFSGSDHIDVISPPDTSSSPDDAASLEVHPNPFNPSAQIVYEVPRAARVRVQILSVTGQVLVTLEDADKPAGRYSLTWDGTDGRGTSASSGLYFCKVIVGKETLIEKMTLLK